MPSSVYAVAVIVLAVIGFLVWFARREKKAGIAVARAEASEAGIKVIAKINEESKKRDEETGKKLGKINSPGDDPTAFWMCDDPKKRGVPNVPNAGQARSGDPKTGN